MTGAHDDSPIGKTMAGERRIPFDKMTAAETYLVIFKDGDHLIFSGRPGLAEDRKNRTRFSRKSSALGARRTGTRGCGMTRRRKRG